MPSGNVCVEFAAEFCVAAASGDREIADVADAADVADTADAGDAAGTELELAQPEITAGNTIAHTGAIGHILATILYIHPPIGRLLAELLSHPVNG